MKKATIIITWSTFGDYFIAQVNPDTGEMICLDDGYALEELPQEMLDIADHVWLGIKKPSYQKPAKRTKQVTHAMYEAADACVREYGSVKAARMINQLYNDGDLTQGQANMLLLWVTQYYMGTNFSHFDLK